MNQERRGASIIALVVGLVVVAALVLGGLYFFSDVLRTKMDTAYAGFAKWTPENIAKDPENYLNFCQKQAEQSLEKCKVSEISINQQSSQFETKLKEHAGLVTTGERVLPDLVAAYKKAEEDKAFPVKWQSIELDQPKCQRKIMSLANEIKRHKEMQAQYKQLIDKLAAQKIKLSEARQKAADQIETIKMSREKVRVAQISEDLQKQLVDIKSVLQASALDIASSSETGDVSLKDIQEKEASTVNMDEFNKIIGK